MADLKANQAAVAFQNARLYENTKHQLRISALLNEAGKVINSSLDTEQILQSLLTKMNELLNADALSIALIDRQTEELVYEIAEGPGRDKIAGMRMALGYGVAGWVVQNAAPVLVPDSSVDSRFHHGVDQQATYRSEAIICAPLIAQGSVLGTIQATSLIAGQFTPDDLQLLANLANLASSALANAQQFEQVQAAEARYLSLFEDNISPILLTDLQGRIVEANRRAHEVLGMKHDSLSGLSILSFHVSKDGEAFGPDDLRTIEVGAVSTFHSLLRRQDEDPLRVEVHVKRTTLHGDPLLRWFYNDISQQAELDAMRDDLTAMLVHDLQSPLANVISSLELLRSELPQSNALVAETILEVALGSSKHLQSLIRSILDINHLEAGRPLGRLTYFDLPATIADAAQTIEAALDDRQAILQVSHDSNLPQAYGEEGMIRRVLVNLLDNSVKYSPRNKAITISVTESKEKSQLLISVSDQGHGVPPKNRQLIFQKFHRPQSVAGNHPPGLGLGLAFCRLVIEAHGGEIWVDDAPGGGARFNFTLATAPS